jgi:CheY-like chemotaxis protein
MEIQETLDSQARPKLPAPGLLSAGLVHDFNNLLTVINGYNEMLLTSCELPEKARQCLTLVRGAGERAASLARSMMGLSRSDFSNGTVLEPGPLDINASVSELVTLAQHLLPDNIELSAILSPGLRPVLADRCGMMQVLLNLVVNSRDAMPEGGKVEIQTADLPTDSPSANPRPYLPAGNYIQLTVTDNGTGMDEATRQRIFEPFYTTKAHGSGTGLGLPMVQHIVKQSGGFLSIESAKGKGTTVRIYLPAAPGGTPHDNSQPAPSDIALFGGHETILIVEDERDLRELMSEFLQRLGYAVLDAGSAAEAVELSGQLNHRLDLLICDLVLPDSTGRELAECLLESRPGLPVLYISGHPAQVAHDTPQPGAQFLDKPFTVVEFGESVRSILDCQIPKRLDCQIPKRLDCQIPKRLDCQKPKGLDFQKPKGLDFQKPKRVLFVDDDAQVVMFASEVLRDAGYEVLVGEDGNVALAIAEKEPLDLVITDLVMREREGLETMMKLKKSHPELPVIAISGAFGGHFLRSASLLGARATLAKPFSGEDLLNVVRTVLGS